MNFGQISSEINHWLLQLLHFGFTSKTVEKKVSGNRRSCLQLSTNFSWSKHLTWGFMLRVNSLRYKPLYLPSQVKSKNKLYQTSLINTNRKLNFQASFKKDIRKTVLTDLINNPPHKIFCHKKIPFREYLMYIKTGRHTTPKTQRHLRICPLCNSGETEDEKNVLFF